MKVLSCQWMDGWITPPPPACRGSAPCWMRCRLRQKSRWAYLYYKESFVGKQAAVFRRPVPAAAALEAACHIQSLWKMAPQIYRWRTEEEPSIVDVDAYLDVWLFIVTASSIFDDCYFVVTSVKHLHVGAWVYTEWQTLKSNYKTQTKEFHLLHFLVLSFH